jgi:hypothetical protein
MKMLLELSLTTSRHMLLVQLISKHMFTNYKKKNIIFLLFINTFNLNGCRHRMYVQIIFSHLIFSVHNLIRFYDLITFFYPEFNPLNEVTIIIIVYILSLRLFSSQINGKWMVLQNVSGIWMPSAFRCRKWWYHN